MTRRGSTSGRCTMGPRRSRRRFHKQGNFIQQIDLTFDVGAVRAAPVQTLSRGRSVAAADMVKPRDIGLSISPAVGGYDASSGARS